MRSTSIMFHPTSAPSVEHVTTEAGDAVLLEAGGIAFTFRTLEELEAWSDSVAAVVADARAKRTQQVIDACRKALSPQGREGLVATDSGLAHQVRP